MVSANARHVSKGGKSANRDNVSMTSDVVGLYWPTAPTALAAHAPRSWRRRRLGALAASEIGYYNSVLQTGKWCDSVTLTIMWRGQCDGLTLTIKW